MGKGIGGHTLPNDGQSVDWITPKPILDALGPFDLDPCASLTQPWPTATARYTVLDDGLRREWHGRVWLNPPYGRVLAAWLARLAEHNCGTALVFARTETAAFFDHVWPRASAVMFLAGRLYFHRPDGSRGTSNAGGPSCLIAYGAADAERLRACELDGQFVRLQG